MGRRRLTVSIAALCGVLSSGARILPETLLLPQCEFYPLREQDRGLLCRYADQPLFVDPDLPEDAPCAAFETRRHRYWGEWFSQADWNACERLGRDFGFDGHAFFPRPHRARYWDAMEKSPVLGFCEVPVAHNYSDDGSDLAKWFGSAIRSTRACRVGGKALILSYRFANENTPERLKLKLDRMRREFGDTFVFVCDVSKILLNPDETLAHGGIRPETAAAWKESVRAYLRVADGVLAGDVFSVVDFEGPARNRVFNSRHYEAVVRLLKEVFDEPEFCGKKLLGLSACIAHENTTRQFWTASEDGLRTLTESLRIAAAAEPDVILLPEWDELNENTCVGPTLMNGLSVKRIVHAFRAQLRRRPLAPLAGDDVSVPNLIVSYRRNVSPGEKLVVDILAVPDGSRRGTVSVGVEVLDEGDRPCASFPAQSGEQSEFRHFRFPVDSAALAEKARAPRVRVTWRDAAGSGAVCDGLMPIDLEPANGWCLKEVHQPIRDLAPVRTAEIAVGGGRLTARLVCDEPIRYAFVTGNGDIQRVVGSPASAVAGFVEDARHVVFQVYGIRPQMLDRQDFAYRAKGVTSAAWLDRFGVHTGLVQRTDWLAAVGDPYFLRIRRADVAGATLDVDFGSVYRGTVPLGTAYEEGAYMAGGPHGSQFMVTRFRRGTRYPSVAQAKEMAFDVALDGDRASMAYVVQVATMGGKTWRSRPFVVEPPSEPGRLRVFGATDGRLREVTMPAARIPRIEYDPNPKTGGYLPTKDRLLHFATVLGGRFSPLTLWNRTTASSMDYPEGLSPDFSTVVSAAPAVTREADGGYSLSFDEDDFLLLPWEVVPQNAAYRLSMEVCPSALDGKRALMTSKSLLNVSLEEGELVVSAPGVRAARTGLRLAAGVWQGLSLSHLGDRFVVTLGERRFETSARLPSVFMSPVAIRLVGRIRNLAAGPLLVL